MRCIARVAEKQTVIQNTDFACIVVWSFGPEKKSEARPIEMFWEFAIVAVVAITAVMGLRILSTGGSKSAYRDAIRVKDGIIDDQKAEIRKWKGRASMAAAPPYGAENVDDITKKLPSWARPFVGPIIEWSKSDEGKEVISKLVEKYAKGGPSGEPEGV